MNIHRVYAPFFRYFRRKRLRLLFETLRPTSSARLLDVGGTEFFWSLAEADGYTLPQITIANLDRDLLPSSGTLRVQHVRADGCRLPFPDRSFDVVFCNSVIEHVGGITEQRQFARELQRVGRAFFVQTPNRGFFFEPHFLTPFFHWLPLGMQKKLARNLTVRGLLSRLSSAESLQMIEEIRLLSCEEFQALFPGVPITREVVLGMTKSLVAASRSQCGATVVRTSQRVVLRQAERHDNE